MRRSRGKSERGFTLVEVLASVVIISIVLIGVVNLLIFTNKTAVSNNDKLVAINLAKASIERIKIEASDHDYERDGAFPYFRLPDEEPDYIGRDANNPEQYDGTNCHSDECERFYAPVINDVAYEVYVFVNQTEHEANLNLINVVVRVEHPDKQVSSTVEGYVNP